MVKEWIIAVIVLAGGVSLIIFLVKQNQKDKKTLIQKLKMTILSRMRMTPELITGNNTKSKRGKTGKTWANAGTMQIR